MLQRARRVAVAPGDRMKDESLQQPLWKKKKKTGMHLHQTAATENVAALLKIRQCYACACTGADTAWSATRRRLRIKHFLFSFFFFAPRCMREWNRRIGHSAAKRPACIITRRSVQATRGNGGIIIPLYLLSVFSGKKKKKERKKRRTTTWRAQANEQWACLLKRQYTPGGIPSTSYHSHLKLNLI